MAAAQALYAEGKAVTANSTSWVDVCTIAAASFTAGKKYLILASALMRVNDSAGEGRMRLVHGTTPTLFTDADCAYENTANVQETNPGWLTMYTQPGTAELVKLQVSCSGAITTTVELGQILAINLDDVGVEDTDYRYNEVTADYTTTASYADQALETFTPNGSDKWLIIGQATYDIAASNSNYRMRLNDSVAGALVTLDIEGEDTTNEKRQHLCMAVVTPTAVSHTFSVQFNHESTAHTVYSSRIFCLNLNKFAQVVSSSNAAGYAPPAVSWGNCLTVAPTPNVTGDWFYWAYYSNDVGSLTDDVYTRLQVNPSGGGLVDDPDYTDSSPGSDGWDPTDITPMNIFNLRSLSSGAARDINLDLWMQNGTTMRAIERTLVAFSLELYSAEPQTISGAGNIATGEAFGNGHQAKLTVSSAGAIASGEALGTTAKLNQTIAGTGGIVSSEALGVPSLRYPQTVSGAGGIASAEAPGSPKINQSIATAGNISSGEASGSPKINLSVAALSIPSGEVFGTPSLDLFITAAGAITSGEAIGAHTITQAGGPQTISSAGGIASAEIFGAQAIELTISAAGDIASGEVFGAHSLAQTITGAGDIASGEASGLPRINMSVLALSIASGEMFGTSELDLFITAAGAITSGEEVGSPVVSQAGGPQAISSAGGIGSGEIFGLLRVDLQIAGAGNIASAETLGSPHVDLWINAAGAITSGEAFGTPHIAFTGIDEPGWVEVGVILNGYMVVEQILNGWMDAGWELNGLVEVEVQVAD